MRHARHPALPRNDEIGEHRNDGPIHGHGDGDLFERYAIEQDFHVLDAVDRYACLTDIAFNARVVAVISAMSGKIEGDRNTLLAGGERLAVKGVGSFGSRKPGILADRPWPPGIHGGARAAREGCKARQAIEM